MPPQQEMEGQDDSEGRERSLSEWRTKLQTSLPKRPDWPGAPRDLPHVSPGQPYTSHDAYQPPRTLRHGDYTKQSAPLIDQVSNRWRGTEKASTVYVSEPEDHELRFCDLEDEGSCPNTIRDLVRSRRLRRMLAVFLVAAVMLYYGWKWYLQPRLQEEWSFKQGFLPARSNGTYGIARAGDFEGTAIQWLDSSLIPGGEADREGKRRLVFVGDIHGCKKELLHLLEKVGFDVKTDHLIATGDTVSKGPDNVGVLDELIRLKADSVRGNHEDRLLEAAKTILGTNLSPQSVAATSQGYAKDATLLKQLKPKHVRYLRDMPLMLRIPALPHASTARHQHKDRVAEDVIVVHAGVVPHVPLEKQDPYFVMNMRSIDDRTHLPSALRETKRGKSRPWMEIWNWYNDRLFRGRSLKGFHLYTTAEYEDEQASESQGWLGSLWDGLFGKGKAKMTPQIVVYGHDSKAGLQMHRWSKGLDSGCVAGGKLTALVLDASGKTEVVQVGCKNYKA
ncbi:hypothetical protein LTR36_001866 [Oleoguttula mirabilis]|uniref:Calcineurin-like phosphoesterase domain-containing protein n=1 Tax=Oleoguttula mirabilis TaxID=1507867 RepID=A0AAV9JNR2_9PEZI|nr:hypothetical protein LTR36_001866 [Oleoguttula mirabilis]